MRRRAGGEQITLRGLDHHLAVLVRRRARERHISLNRAALELLEKGVGRELPEGRTEEKCIGDALDHLAGTWSGEEAEEFSRSVRACEQIDDDFWK